TDYNAAPVGVALVALVLLVVEVAGTSHQAPVGSSLTSVGIDNEPHRSIQCLLVSHGEAVADRLQPCTHHAAQRSTGHVVGPVVGISDAVQVKRLQERMYYPAVGSIVQAV